MTFADTDLDMNIQAKSWIAILLAASQLINIGITAASLPPGTYVHAVESIPWLYLLIRFNKITNGEPDYLRFTELWTISFVGIDISWAIYYFYLATVSETGHFFGMGVTDLLAAAAIALAYHSQKRRGTRGECYRLLLLHGDLRPPDLMGRILPCLRSCMDGPRRPCLFTTASNEMGPASHFCCAHCCGGTHVLVL